MATEPTTEETRNQGVPEGGANPPEAPEQREGEAAQQAAGRPSGEQGELEVPPELGRAMRFARRHPALAVLGAAGVGLFGGVEVAAGMLLGAGVLAVLRPKPRRAVERGVQEAREQMKEAREQVKETREQVKETLSRAPHELRQRARAIAQAARGKLEPRT